MTDDLGELERRLEQATARHGPEQDSPEPETAALRAAWLALGDLLEAAQPQAEAPLRPAPLSTAPRQRRWAPATIAALAASVLIALTATWCLLGMKPVAVQSQPPAVVAGNDRAPSAPTRQTPVAARDAEIAWDDSLDQEIERAGQAIARAERDQFASAAASNRVQYQMEILKKELDDSPL